MKTNYLIIVLLAVMLVVLSSCETREEKIARLSISVAKEELAKLVEENKKAIDIAWNANDSLLRDRAIRKNIYLSEEIEKWEEAILLQRAENKQIYGEFSNN